LKHYLLIGSHYNPTAEIFVRVEAEKGWFLPFTRAATGKATQKLLAVHKN
jgi:hypothetical protein